MAIIPQSFISGLNQQSLTTGHAMAPTVTAGVRAGQIGALYGLAGQQQTLQQQLDAINSQNAYYQGQLGLGQSQLQQAYAALAAQQAWQEEQMAMQREAADAQQKYYEDQLKLAQDKAAADKQASDRAIAAQQDALAQQQQQAQISGAVGGVGALSSAYGLGKNIGLWGGEKAPASITGVPSADAELANVGVPKVVPQSVYDQLGETVAARSGGVLPESLGGGTQVSSTAGPVPAATPTPGGMPMYEYPPAPPAGAPSISTAASNAAPTSASSVAPSVAATPAAADAAWVYANTPASYYATGAAPEQALAAYEASQNAVPGLAADMAAMYESAPAYLAPASGAAPAIGTGAEMVGLTGAPAIESSALAGETLAGAGASGGLGLGTLSGVGLALAPLGIAMAAGMPDPISAIMANNSLTRGEAQSTIADQYKTFKGFNPVDYGLNLGLNAQDNMKALGDLAQRSFAPTQAGGNPELTRYSPVDQLDTMLRFADTAGYSPDQFKKFFQGYTPQQMQYLEALYNADPNRSTAQGQSMATQELADYGSFLTDTKAPWNQTYETQGQQDQAMTDFWAGNQPQNQPSQPSGPTGGVFDQISQAGSALLGRNWNFPSDWPTDLSYDQYVNMVKGSAEYLGKQQNV